MAFSVRKDCFQQIDSFIPEPVRLSSAEVPENVHTNYALMYAAIFL